MREGRRMWRERKECRELRVEACGKEGEKRGMKADGKSLDGQGGKWRKTLKQRWMLDGAGGGQRSSLGHGEREKEGMDVGWEGESRERIIEEEKSTYLDPVPYWGNAKQGPVTPVEPTYTT